jgi:hypothetical protein
MYSRRILRVLAAVVVAVLSILLGEQVLPGRAYYVSGKPEPVEVNDIEVNRCLSDDAATVAMWIRSVDVVSGTATMSVGLCIEPRVLAMLRPVGESARPVFVQRQSRLEVAQPFRHGAITVIVDGTLNLQSEVQIPLVDLIASGSPELHVTTAQFGIWGAPEEYPFDSYTLSGEVVVKLPPGVIDPHSRRREEGYIPVEEEISAAPALRSFSIRDRTLYRGLVDIEIERSHTVKAFVIALLLVPLLLISVMAMVVTRARRVDGPALLVGTGAILLGILPIRTVLVPSSLASLTTVDYVLAWEVGILAAVMVWLGTSQQAARRGGDSRPRVHLAPLDGPG